MPDIRALPILVLFACGPEKVDLVDTIDSADPTATTDIPVETDPAPECDPDVKSSCDTAGSVIQGAVRLKEGLTDETRGDLLITLVHEAAGGSSGGIYHTHSWIEDADLSEPVPFKLDMCDNGAMWSEDNGEYSLQVVLDLDGSNGGADGEYPTSVLPEVGEPARRVKNLRLSCSEEAMCLDIELNCLDGSSCGTFSDDDCDDHDPICDSDVSLCDYY